MLEISRKKSMKIISDKTIDSIKMKIHSKHYVSSTLDMEQKHYENRLIPVVRSVKKLLCKDLLRSIGTELRS